jgi:hypothetical protein
VWGDDFWNPSWTLAAEAPQTADIVDVQVAPDLLGFGSALAGCAICRTLDGWCAYGLGVILSGSWMLQKPLFAGYGAVAGYLPARKIAVAVATIVGEGGFDAQGNYKYSSHQGFFAAVGNYLALDYPRGDDLYLGTAVFLAELLMALPQLKAHVLSALYVSCSPSCHRIRLSYKLSGIDPERNPSGVSTSRFKPSPRAYWKNCTFDATGEPRRPPSWVTVAQLASCENLTWAGSRRGQAARAEKRGRLNGGGFVDADHDQSVVANWTRSGALTTHEARSNSKRIKPSSSPKLAITLGRTSSLSWINASRNVMTGELGRWHAVLPALSLRKPFAGRVRAPCRASCPPDRVRADLGRRRAGVTSHTRRRSQ